MCGPSAPLPPSPFRLKNQMLYCFRPSCALAPSYACLWDQSHTHGWRVCPPHAAHVLWLPPLEFSKPALYRVHCPFLHNFWRLGSSQFSWHLAVHRNPHRSAGRTSHNCMRLAFDHSIAPCALWRQITRPPPQKLLPWTMPCHARPSQQREGEQTASSPTGSLHYATTQSSCLPVATAADCLHHAARGFAILPCACIAAAKCCSTPRSCPAARVLAVAQNLPCPACYGSWLPARAARLCLCGCQKATSAAPRHAPCMHVPNSTHARASAP